MVRGPVISGEFFGSRTLWFALVRVPDALVRVLLVSRHAYAYAYAFEDQHFREQIPIEHIFTYFEIPNHLKTFFFKPILRSKICPNRSTETLFFLPESFEYLIWELEAFEDQNVMTSCAFVNFFKTYLGIPKHKKSIHQIALPEASRSPILIIRATRSKSSRPNHMKTL